MQVALGNVTESENGITVELAAEEGEIGIAWRIEFNHARNVAQLPATWRFCVVGTTARIICPPEDRQDAIGGLEDLVTDANDRFRAAHPEA